MLHSYLGIMCILFFLLVTYSWSAYEKISELPKSVAFYRDLYKSTFNEHIITIILYIIIGLEIMISCLLIIGIWKLYAYYDSLIAQYALLSSCALLIILLIGLRIIKDYSGAAGIGIYFLLSVFGMFWAQFI
jgi:hypothetical protein